MKHRLCSCRDCRRHKRDGYVLGTRVMGFWIMGFNGQMQYYHGPVSDYVRSSKFSKGRRERKPNRPIDVSDD